MYDDPYTLAIIGSQMQRATAREANEANYKIMMDARRWDAQQAKKQMDFQERMSSTAHQREVRDLIAAGLNPILTATGGAGAAAMSGASAQSQSPAMEAELKDNPLKNVAQDKLAAKRFKELELENLELNKSMNEQNIIQSKSQTRLNEESLRMMDANILNAMEQLNTQRSQQFLNSASAIRQQADAALANAHRYGVEFDNSKKEFQTMPYREGANELLKSFLESSWTLPRAIRSAGEGILNLGKPYNTKQFEGAPPKKRQK